MAGGSGSAAAGQHVPDPHLSVHEAPLVRLSTHGRLAREVSAPGRYSHNWRSFTEIRRKRNARKVGRTGQAQLAFVYRDRAEKERQFANGSPGRRPPALYCRDCARFLQPRNRPYLRVAVSVGGPSRPRREVTRAAACRSVLGSARKQSSACKHRAGPSLVPFSAGVGRTGRRCQGCASPTFGHP
jgi:hypothetical protein